MLLVSAAIALAGCSWVDGTGSQGGPITPSGDGGAALLSERDEQYVRRISEKRFVQANFTLSEQGPAAAAACGDYLLPADSAATLADACDARIAAEDCALAFTVEDSANSRYATSIPRLRQPVALSYLVRSQDIDGNVSDSTLTLCLQAVNDAPIAVDHQYQVEYREQLETSDADFDANCAMLSGSGVLKGAEDDFDYATVSLDGAACLSAELVDAPAHASEFELNALGGFRYVPRSSLGPGETDRFTYRVDDGDLKSAEKTVTITVVGENKAPEILATGTFTVDENGELDIPLTALARDPEGEPLHLAGRGDAAHGEVIQSADGDLLTYRPSEDYTGDDGFDFTVQDIAGATASGEVRILVMRANRAPTIEAPAALNYFYADAAPTPRQFSVRVGDRETAPALLQLAASSSRPDVATITAPRAITGAGIADFIVNAVDNGATTLTLTVTDGGLADPPRAPKSTTVRVLVEIRGVNNNRPPVAADAERNVQQDASLTIDLADLSSDPDGDALSYTLLDERTGVSLSGSSLRVRGAATRDIGRFALDYRVSDGDKSATARVTINVVERPNSAPQARNGSARIEAGETARIDLSTLTSDEDGDTLSYTLVDPPSEARLSGSTLRVSSDADADDSDIRVTYRVSDGELSDTAVVTVTITERPNTAPVADDASDSIQAGESASIDLRTISRDADGDTLSYALLGPPTGATLSGTTLTVTTRDDAVSGVIRVVYRASDGEASDTGTFSVSVTERPNTPPTTRNINRAILAGQSTSLDLAGISADADGDALSYSLAGGAPPQASLSGSVLTVTTDAADATQVLRVDFVVSDGEDSATGRLTVNVQALPPNSAPQARDGALSVTRGSSASLDLRTLASDVDPGDTLSFSLPSPPGQAELDGSRLTFESDDDDPLGPLEFDFVVSDGELSDSATIRVTIVE